MDLKDFPEDIIPTHTVDVFAGTDGYHQDEFLRGDCSKDLFRGSIATPSLVASILNVKYVNSAPLHRIEQKFSRNGVNISKQTMSNWMINSSNFPRYTKQIKGS